MILRDFAALLADTSRSKAYLQMMVSNSLLPDICIIFSNDIERLKNEAESFAPRENTENEKYFDKDEPLLVSVKRGNIPCHVVKEGDINSSAMFDIISNLPQNYIVYSGYGGAILKPSILKAGKRIIHIHAGLLPMYRGSTTVYYSYLQERQFGASAIFFNEGIDTGEVITSQSFPAPNDDVDIDHVYEPYIRSQTLKHVLEIYRDTGTLEGAEQPPQGGETYFIIHPVLKHLALLGLKAGRQGCVWGKK